MPVLFVGHGSPMNAIEDNRWSRAFRSLGEALPKPSAILSISAHWFVPGTFLTGNDKPETIHDFGGFPQPLYEVQYPAPGQPDLAKRIADMLSKGRPPNAATIRNDWGLDHGTWSVLVHFRPDADCPVLQLSIDRRLPPAEHLALARSLAPLREQNVLILGSGNMTHNLRHAVLSMQSGDESTPEWASRFDAETTRAVEQHDADYLLRALDTDAGRMSHPTPDHYLPLIYALGASSPDDAVQFPITGWDLGSLSMRAIRWG
jgi:4,5-DOPA dioxygenase extradiol